MAFPTNAWGYMGLYLYSAYYNGRIRARGERDLFTQFCIGCHQVGAGGGAIPDLARSSDGIFKNYEDILLNGILVSQGMPNFGEYLTKEDVADIKSYVLYTATTIRTGKDLLKQ